MFLAGTKPGPGAAGRALFGNRPLKAATIGRALLVAVYRCIPGRLHLFQLFIEA